jgi:hypothetical protein
MKLERHICIAMMTAALLTACRGSSSGTSAGVGTDAASAERGGGPATPASADDFEGTVQLSMPGSGLRPQTFWLKGGKVRWNLGADAAGGFQICDAAARRLFTVNPATPSVIVTDIPPLAANGANGANETWSFTSQGGDSVSAYPCERLRATNDSLAFGICAVHGALSVALAYAFPNATEGLPFLPALQARGQFPLAASRADGPDGGLAFMRGGRLTALQVRPAPVDAAQFEVPKFPQTVVNRPPPKAALR